MGEGAGGMRWISGEVAGGMRWISTDRREFNEGGNEEFDFWFFCTNFDFIDNTVIVRMH
jgi:hypothetical protein